MSKLPQNLHLGVSSFIVLLMAFVYGANPSGILPYIFGFEVEDIELKNIFRAIMGSIWLLEDIGFTDCSIKVIGGLLH